MRFHPQIQIAAASLVALSAAAQSYPPPSQLPVHAELPDPLVTFAGKRVESRKQWERERRPELKRLFQHYMYGTMPPPPDNVRGTVEREDRQALGGKATLREITLRFGPEGTPPLQMMVVVPNQHKGPAPVFLGLSFSGNHTLLNDPKIRIPDSWMRPGPGVVNERATTAGRGSAVDVWNIAGSVDRGYAVATIYYGDIAPDHPGLADGLFPAYRRAGDYDWGAVAAWAWGLSRAVDYLRTDKSLDAKKIAVVGHSRLGKAAMVAGAFDERIALAIPLQAGCGGTAPSRGKVGETVQMINDHFPHWFNANFKLFNTQPERIPFDQHDLVALMAPRPVLFSNATEDLHANPAGQFEVLQAADPVYRFLGVEGLSAKSMPPPGQLVDSRLGYFIRPGKHSMTLTDWKAFWDYADRQWGKPRS